MADPASLCGDSKGLNTARRPGPTPGVWFGSLESLTPRMRASAVRVASPLRAFEFSDGSRRDRRCRWISGQDSSSGSLSRARPEAFSATGGASANPNEPLPPDLPRRLRCGVGRGDFLAQVLSFNNRGHPPHKPSVRRWVLRSEGKGWELWAETRLPYGSVC